VRRGLEGTWVGKTIYFSAGLLVFFCGKGKGFNLPVCSLIFMMEDSRRCVNGMAVMMEEWDFLCCRPSLPGWCQLIGFTYLAVQAGHGTEKAIYDVEDG